MVPNPNPFHPLNDAIFWKPNPGSGRRARSMEDALDPLDFAAARVKLSTQYSLKASPIPVQLRAVAFHPGLGLVGARKKRAREAPEFVGVVELAQMRNLMRGEIVEDERRRENEPPG